MKRRDFLSQTALGTSALALGGTSMADRLFAVDRNYRFSLKADAIGVSGNVLELMKPAAKMGYESIALPCEEIVSMQQNLRKQLASQATDLGLEWGSAGLPLQFRNSKEEYDKDLARLPQHARAMADVGITRIGTWIMPSRNDMDYAQNMEFHAERLRPAAQIMADHGVRLGLEYVGPKTLRDSRRFSFIQNGRQLKDLIDLIAVRGTGVILDSFHWYTAEESSEDLRIWTNDDIVAVDLNDADRNLGPQAQIDGNRELPGATGVIDLKAFVEFLKQESYNGPVRAEPFNATLSAMSNELAMQATLDAMRKFAS